jgi:outer membrane protein OmpA-like peptidoglycan-associated protein
LATAKGEPTARDELLAIKGPSADSSATDEAAVSASAQAVPASRADETAATARNVETLATDLQGQTGDQLAEPDGVATELMDKSGRDAAIDAEPTASGSSETAERQEAPGALLASGGSSATAASDAVEPATGPVAADISAPVNLSLVHFDTSSSSLSPGAVMMVDRAAASLEGLSDKFRVEIKGFTDTVGSEAFNLWLAERRVNRVIDALVERGIPRENLIASPRGPFGLPVPTGDNVSEPLNRCVAITLVEAQ